jgi:hypothetical protein
MNTGLKYPEAALSPPPSVALEAALEPFAKISFDPAFWEDADPINIDTNRFRFKDLTVGDFNRAAKVYAALIRPQPGGAVAGTERGTP